MDKIQTLCREKDITLANLERELDFGNGSIRRWDNNSPSVDKVLKVANYFGVSINFLLGEERSEEVQLNNLINIENKEGQLIVSSREIARNFEKEHYHVTEAIENKIKNLTHEDSGVRISDLFIENQYEHKGNTYKEYLLTRDGFSFIVMGFTGSKADQWKLKYIEAFNKMESALKEVYHISETAIVNNIMEELESKIFTSIDSRLSKYEENYRPTHANKISINNYIKKGLGDLREAGEVDLVKDRVLLVLNAEAWQDVPYEKLVNNMHLIDESIRAVKSFRSKSQLSLFENK